MSVIRKVTLASLSGQLAADIRRAGSQAMSGLRSGACRAQAIVVGNTPVDTGRLKSNHRTTDTSEGAEITNATPYAGIVEHRQGYVADVLPEMGKAIVAEIERAVKP